MNRFVIFDGNATLHRAYHALPPLTTKAHEPINAVYGMMSMLLKILQDFRPSHISFAFDTKEPTFRNKLSEEYQAQRAEVDTDLISQFEKARTTLTAFHIPFFEKPGYEADDVIGTIVTQLETDPYFDEIIVVTGDRDLLQLVTNKIFLYMPNGLNNGKLMKAEDTKTKMGVYPDKIVEYKALVGDPSDNYKGVAGIGPKTAIKLIEEFGTVENIFSKSDEIPVKLREKLVNGQTSAHLSKKLATIVRDVPLPEFHLDDCALWKLDSSEGIALFEEYGFKTLTKRMQDTAKLFIAKNQLSLL